MRLAAWAAVLLLGVATGALSCVTLVVRRSRMLVAGLLTTLAGSALLGACLMVWLASPRPDAMIAVIFIGIAASVGGYALATALLPLLGRSAPPLEPTVGAATGPDRLGVVLLSDAEPEDYDPRHVTSTLRRFEDSNAPLPPELAKPLVYAAERSRYSRAKRSPARDTVRAMTRTLESSLRASGHEADVVVAFCDDGASLARSVAELAGTRHSNVVIALLTVARTTTFVTELAGVGLRQVADAGVHVETTEPLWSSRELVAMVCGRVLSALGEDRAQGGVCLVDVGEPVELELENNESVEQNTYFAERVRAELVEAGVATERIRRGWLQWEEPDVSEVARHLAAVGADRIVFAPVPLPTETMMTLFDLSYASERASVDAAIPTITLGAWGDDPAVARALVEQIEIALKRMRDWEPL